MRRNNDSYDNAMTLIADPERSVEGVAMLKAVAEYGDPKAMCEYGRLLDTPGAPVTQNPDEAFQWYLRSAEYGNDRGQFYTGLSFYEGRITEQDLASALKWFTLSAEKGYAIAQYYLGHMYFHGNGVPQDETEALRWYRMSVDRECNEASIALGDIYADPKNKGRNYNEAFSLYSAAMRSGMPIAYYKVGMMHYNGMGRPVNMIAASQRFREGANLDSMECYYMLGIMYYYGKGVEKDVAKGTRYLTVAEQGKNTDATEFLNKALDRKKKEWKSANDPIKVNRLNTPDLLYIQEDRSERKGGLFGLFRRK